MSATLQLTREPSRPLIELRRGRFDVVLDGRTIGSIENHGAFEAQVDAGHHVLRLRKGRYTSRELVFDVSDGQVANFRCHGASIWPTYVASILVPATAISLRQA